MTKINVSLAGASGYTGMECLRYLISHPAFKVYRLYGDTSAGKNIEDIYPAFSGYYNLQINDLSNLTSDNSDVVILAMPHGKSAEIISSLINQGYSGKIIDLGSDFRFNSGDEYFKWYRLKHNFPELLSTFEYGLTEFYSDKISNAKYVANPGCFATAMQLAIIPLAKSRLVQKLYITGLTGSSGSGSTASNTTHYSSRYSNIKAYKAFEHKHLGETSQTLKDLCGYDPELFFIPVSAPIVRGIWMTISGEISQNEDIGNVFMKFYKNSSMIRIRSGLPELKHVLGSAFTDIGWIQKGSSITIGITLDNLGKGAASQAIQNMNLMFGLPESTGLFISPQIL